MAEHNSAPLTGAIRVDEQQIRGHIDEAVRSSVEETLNALLDAEADQIIGAQRYEPSADRRDTRAGHYERKLETKAGEPRTPAPNGTKSGSKSPCVYSWFRDHVAAIPLETISAIPHQVAVVGTALNMSMPAMTAPAISV